MYASGIHIIHQLSLVILQDCQYITSLIDVLRPNNGVMSHSPGNGSSRRRRKAHTNSHSGCLTCKQRRVKCDERRPICRRCQTAHKECRQDPKLVQESWTDGQLTFPVRTQTATPDPKDYEQICLTHFESVTLPAFSYCEPSSIWGYIQQELRHSSSIRSMAIALGHEHRLATSPTASVTPETSALYIRAIQSLRQTIETAETERAPDSIFNIVFHCLLLVILQCFRKSFDELNIHLQHGLRIAAQAAADCSAATVLKLRDAHRLLKQYSIAVALFNPLLPQSAVASGIATATANQALSHPEDLKEALSLNTISDEQALVDEEQNLLLDLISTTITHTRPELNGPDGELIFVQPLEMSVKVATTVSSFRARHLAFGLALQRAREKVRMQHIEVLEARCMLLGIYLRCRWSGYACNYDIEAETFRQIVDKLGSLLERQQAMTVDRDAAFTVGLGTVAPLFYTAIMCRNPSTRWKAVSLLASCPQQEGPWNTKLAEVICRTIIACEEQKAQDECPGYALTGYIPEHCRVAYYYYYRAMERNEAETLRVFRRRRSSPDVFTHEDLSLNHSYSAD
ncbi:hypothetical protein AMS68_007474 [Peltaster fructicola]|uniref:Zn(2)-C6 fungal-type domain-containing protein n=1 Tax=Peltaster fructicola TaxID=286661 RepID=A0A6H0Y4K0_9PEZI|nr:hypothetical protein AMS68_007474 [Peltaster fructicola]